MAREKEELTEEFKEIFDFQQLGNFGEKTFERADLIAEIINKNQTDGRKIIPPDKPLPPHDI